MKKVKLFTLSIIMLTLLGGCHSNNTSKISSEPSSELSSVTKNKISLVNTKENNVEYKIKQEKSQTTYINLIDLKTKNKIELANSQLINNSNNREFELKISIHDNKYNISFSLLDNKDLSQESTNVSEQTYTEFVPYKSFGDSKLGVFILTNDQNIIKTIKNNPDDISKYLNGDSDFYQLSVDIK